MHGPPAILFDAFRRVEAKTRIKPAILQFAKRPRRLVADRFRSVRSILRIHRDRSTQVFRPRFFFLRVFECVETGLTYGVYRFRRKRATYLLTPRDSRFTTERAAINGKSWATCPRDSGTHGRGLSMPDGSHISDSGRCGGVRRRRRSPVVDDTAPHRPCDIRRPRTRPPPRQGSMPASSTAGKSRTVDCSSQKISCL